MFESLSTRLQDVFRSLRNETRLTEQVVEVALREIRLAFLEADVNFKVVKAFVDRVRDKAVDQAVLGGLSPAQQVLRIVRDEMLALFGDTAGGLPPTTQSPRVIMLLGLQGSGKTTTSGKLARYLAAAGAPSACWCRPTCGGPPPSSSCRWWASRPARRCSTRQAISIRCRARAARMVDAKQRGFDVVIVDTAGRLHIDDDLMVELQAITDAVQPSDRLYVADAMTGQDAIKSAGEFHRRVGSTGVVLTKMDGDARGGAALSVVSVVGVPIAFVGSGERLEDLEPFHADRVVSRVLGMGDVLTLIEKAEQVFDEKQAAALEQKIRKDDFTLDDFREQLRAIRKMGPLESILGMLPGMGNIKQMAPEGVDERQLLRVEAIINSMTPTERRRHDIDQRQPPEADRRAAAARMSKK